MSALIVDFFSAWFNWPYLFALAIALSFASFQVLFGFIPDAIELDVDTEGDLDVDMDTDAGADLATKASFASDAMAFVGLGKAPLAVLALVFLFLFGSIGLFLNVLVHPALTPLAIIGIFGLSFAGASITTGRLADVLNQVLPGHESVTSRGAAFLHREGTAVTVINERGGEVELAASSWVNAAVAPGRAPILRGTRVLLVSYDQSRFRYTVEPI